MLQRSRLHPPPPPPVVNNVPKSEQRQQNGLGVRIQGFKECESQFGEWPHMCTILSEEQVVDEDPGFVRGVVTKEELLGSSQATGATLTSARRGWMEN